MNDLPFDIVFHIASYVAKLDYTTWIRLLLIDARFREYVWANPKQVEGWFKTITNCNAIKKTCLFGQLHSFNDEPAFIFKHYRSWFVTGKRHRDNDRPAYIDASGKQEWYVNDMRHRDNNQPAVIYADGSREWWIHGVRINK